MSLQIWLPLNGSPFKNQGLHYCYTIGTIQASFQTQAGKISPLSNKWTTNGQAVALYEYMNTLKTYTQYSICAWVQYTSINDTGHSSTICSSGDWNKSNTTFALYNHNGTGYTQLLVPGLGVWNNQTITLDSPIKPSIWYHICITYNGEKTLAYINGVKQQNEYAGGGITQSSETTSLYIGSATYYSGFTIKGSINDFRIYDHCLSLKEVKLLSQGLVAHYKLSDLYTEATENKSSYPTPEGAISLGWDASKHPNAISVGGGWSNGYNSGVDSPSIGYHACWELIDNIPTMVFRDLNSEVGFSHRWLGINSKNFKDIIVENSTYTISFDAKASVPNKQMECGCYYYKYKEFGTFGTEIGNCDLTTEWQRYSMTYQSVGPRSSGSTMNLYFYGHIGDKEGIVYVRNVQVELKDHATPYTSSSRAAETVAYDCSGYGKHGILSGGLTSSPDTPRYQYCTLFNNGRYIALPSHSYEGMKDSYTISYWSKIIDMTGRMVWGFSDGNRLNLYPAGGWFNWNSGDGSENPFRGDKGNVLFERYNNAWHHYTITGNGSKTQLYIDGDYVGTALTYKNITGTQIILSGWNDGSEYKWNNGQLSDFRVYATALSTDAIKQLYQSSISILSNGTLQCSEIVEKSTNLQYHKNGIVQAKLISEVGYTNKMKIKTLSDGSAWARIFYHKNNNGAILFTSIDEILYTTTTNKFSRLKDIYYFKGLDEKYEFLLNFKALNNATTFDNQYNRWKQTNAPQDETYKNTDAGTAVVSGYEPIKIDWNTNYWGGLGRQSESSTALNGCYIDGSIGHSNWFFAIGASEPWNGGVPGPNSSAVEETELWVRIDNLPKLTKLSIFDGALQAHQIYEL